MRLKPSYADLKFIAGFTEFWYVVAALVLLGLLV